MVEELINKIKNKAKDSNFKYKVIKKQLVLPFGPGVYKYRIDIKVS